MTDTTEHDDKQNPRDARILDTHSGYLSGRLLLAMPSLRDGGFEKSLIYVCSHDARGAMGIVINQPLKSVEFGDILSQLKLDGIEIDPRHLPDVHFGGPVEITRGFVLHSTDRVHNDTVILDKNFGITATVEILQDIVTGCGPQKSIFALGYSGWGAGQLEQEIHDNVWLPLDADPGLIFNTAVDEKWDRALENLGISPARLSTVSGNA
ncbi:MAG: YqgE/AlgH family protein [Micavibrio sp.]|nr:MAG: YqgE/AlgH family protein [Micavibrio sp.]